MVKDRSELLNTKSIIINNEAEIAQMPVSMSKPVMCVLSETAEIDM